MEQQTEVWKSIKGYEGFYEVSSIGRVRSLDRIIQFERNGKISTIIKKGKILHPRDDRYGYLNVCLSKDGKGVNRKVHRLVAEAFIPNPDNKPQVNHRNPRKKHDNSITNLEWISREGNYEHAWIHGLGGAKSKLSDEQIKFIINHYDKDSKEYSMKALAERFSVSHETIRRILFKAGIHTPKTNSSATKLNYEGVLYILGNYSPGSKEFGTNGLGKKLGVSAKTVSRIINGEVDLTKFA